MKTQRRPLPHPLRRQRGVVLVFALIALLILMIGAVGLVRSFSSTQLNAGSTAFKKDLVNRNEAVVGRVLTLVRQPNNLSSETVAANPVTTGGINYSPRILSYNNQGIPDVLLMNDSDFNASGAGSTNNDIPMSDGVTVRFVIDRQCDSAGAASTLGTGRCITGNSQITGGSSDVPIRAENASRGGAGAVTVSPVYRLTIRAIGPRNTMAFYQTTFTL